MTIALYTLLVAQLFIMRWLNKKNRQLINSLKDLNEKQSAYINEQAADYREILIFSIRAIIKEAIIKEDYETAQKCKEILDKYEENIK